MTRMPAGWWGGPLVGLLCTLAPLSAQTQTASSLDRVTLTPSETDGWVVLEAHVPDPQTVRHFLLTDPLRLVVDIEGARHELGRFDFPELRLGPVRGVRSSQFRADAVRLVLDLVAASDYRVDSDASGVRVELSGSAIEFVPGPGASPADDATPADTPVPKADEARLGLPPNATAGSTARRDLAPAVPAPPEGPILAVVTGIAGTTFYVDVGTRHGLFDGDTIDASRVAGSSRETRAGPLTVVSSASREALLTWAARPFPVTIGDSLSLDLRGPDRALTGRVAIADTPTPTPGTEGSAASTGTAESGAAGVGQPAAAFQPIVTGRLHVSMNAQSSTTQWRGTGQPLARTFVTPTTRLRLNASGLPGNVVLRANVRGSYRHEATSLIDPESSIRVYELSAEKELDRVPAALRMGRFYSPHEAFTGYWDGAMARIGRPGLGVGAAVGLEPDRWNEGLTSSRPKQAAFLDFRATGQSRGVSGAVAAVRVRPEAATFEHVYLGWSGQAWVGDLSLAHTVQIDRDPVTDGWVISDLLAEASVPLGGPLQVHGTWSRRSPFYFWRSSAPVSFRRDDIGGGISLDLSGAYVNANASVHQADADTAWTTSYAGSIRIPSLAGTRLGAHGSASYWDDDLLRMTNLSAGVDRSWGRAFGRLGYRLIDSRSAWFEQRTHQTEALIDLPVQTGVRASALGHLRWGQGIRSYRLQVGIWRSF